METVVNLVNKTIKWNVAGTTIATHIVNFLGDQSRTFRPYIEMVSPHDIVEYIV